MAETNLDPNKGTALPDNANANNDAVARKLAEQDQAGRSTVPDAKGIADAGSALDTLVKQAEEAAAAPPDDKAKEAADAAAAAAAAAAQTPEQKNAAEEAKAAEDAKAAELKKAEDIFKDVPALPPNASTKSVEAFSTVKIRAAQEIARLTQELEKAQKASKELEAKSKTPPPEFEATKKELEELRQWRAKLDVDADPRFKEFDSKIEKNRNTIYELLKGNPVVSEKVIEQIKSFGGPDKADMSKLFEAMKDPTLQRMVESKVLDIKTAEIEKGQAIREAKGNVTQWMEERNKAQEAERNGKIETTRKELDGFLGGLEWFKERAPAATATDAEKKAIEADNALIKQLREELAPAVSDDSPRTKAILLTGLVQLTRLQKVHEGTVAELASTKKELATTKEFLEKVKASSTSRLRESAAPVDGRLPVPKTDIFNTPATSALDALAAQITEQRNAKGS